MAFPNLNDETESQTQLSDSRTQVQPPHSLANQFSPVSFVQTGLMAAMCGRCDPTILITTVQVRGLIREGLTWVILEIWN